MWLIRYQDQQHNCVQGTCLVFDVKIDRDIHDPYGKLDQEVWYANKAQFFDITLPPEQLLQSTFCK